MLLACALSFSITGQVRAQESDPTLQLRLRKVFGYDAGSNIQGEFTLTVPTIDGLTKVSFYIDDEMIGVVDQPPFEINFSTSSYTLGEHCLYATGELEDGGRVRSERRCYNLLDPDAAQQEVVKIALPLVVGMLGITVVGTLITSMVTRRRESFRLGVYGFAGGAMCPACEFPFARHMLAPNLIVGKLERCPHCGKWLLARRASKHELAAAETRYLQASQDRSEKSESSQARLRKQIEDSRYESS